MPAAGLSTFRCTREGWRVRTLGETGAKETRDLLDERLGRQESVVLLGELFDKLLVLVKPGLFVNMQVCMFTQFTHFFKSSTDMYSRSICFARSISAASARMQMDIRGRGTFGSLNRTC